MKNPRSLLDLLTGKIDLRKNWRGGLMKAAQKEEPSGLAQRLAGALSGMNRPVHVLIAARDTTALAFMASWKTGLFDAVRNADNCSLELFDTASHSFADAQSKDWLYRQIACKLAEG